MFKRFNTIYQEEAPDDGGAGGGGGDPDDKGGDPDNSLLPGGEGDDKLADGEYFLSDGIKGIGDKPEYFDSRRFKSVAHQAEQYIELEKKFGSHTGTPKEGYNLGDDMDKEDALVQEFVKFATESGMNQDGFDKGLELFMQAVSAKEEVDAQSEMDKLGDNAEGRIKTVEMFMKNNLSAEDFAEQRKAVNNASVVMLVEKLINATAPKKLPIDGGDNPEGLTWDKIKEAMNAKDETGNWKRSDPEYEKKIQKMLKDFGGEKPDIETIS